MTLPAVPELAPYQDEPKQAPSGRAAKTGRLEMRFEDRGARSILAHLYREAPLLVQQALYWDESLPGMPCVFVISTAGGVLQGDRLTVDVTMGPGSMAHITTQSATKIHEMDANFATQLQSLHLAENSYLELMPGTTIPHRHSRYFARTDITVHPTATLLFSEVVMPGRKHHRGGELFEYDVYSAQINAERPDGTDLFTEKLLIEPARWPVRHAGAMGGYDVLGNVVLLTPAAHADAVLEQLTPGARAGEPTVAGASRLPGEAGLIYKVLGSESAPVHAKVREFWALARRTVLGETIPDQPLWG